MKKILALLLMLSLSFTLITGCDSSNNASSDSQKDSVSSENQVDKASDTGDVGDYHVTIKDFEMGKDYEGKSAIIVTFEWTNNSDKDATFEVALDAKAFQKGVQLDSATLSGDKMDTFKSIKSGATQTVTKAFKTTDETDVEVEVKELITFTDTGKVSKTFKISK